MTKINPDRSDRFTWKPGDIRILDKPPKFDENGDLIEEDDAIEEDGDGEKIAKKSVDA